MGFLSAEELVKQEEAPVSVTEMQVSRRREPEHFVLKVESFSQSKLKKYESDEFEAGGYKWRLILYPNGDKERNGSDHISLYISICDTQNLPLGWEVEADFSLFVYNSLLQKYQTYKLADITWFNWLKTESGYAQLMPLDEFKDTSNGYLFGDACVFGAEVYVTGYTAIAKRHTLSMMDTNADANTKTNTDTDTDTNANIFTWTVGSFSTLNDTFIQSENFIIGDVQWKLRLCPKGYGVGKDKCISIFLAIADDELTKLADQNRNVNVEFRLRIRNQLNTDHVEKQTSATRMLSNSLQNWGFLNFMPLSDVNDKSKGFLKNDTVLFQVEITKVEKIIKNPLCKIFCCLGL